MAESLRKGLRHIVKSCTGVLISLADQPLISDRTIRTLIACHHKEPDSILLPKHGTKKGHPVLLPKILLEDIYQGGILRESSRDIPKG